MTMGFLKKLQQQKSKEKAISAAAAANMQAVAAEFLRGNTDTQEIRKVTRLTTVQVHRALDKLRDQWASEAISDFDAYIGLLLKKIDDREREIWAWLARTRKTYVETRKENIDGIDDTAGVTIVGKTTTIKHKREGQGQAFKLLHDCNQQRLDILEMVTRVKGGMASTVNNTQINLTTVSDDLLRQLKEETTKAIEDQSNAKGQKPAEIDAEFTVLAREIAEALPRGGDEGTSVAGVGEGEDDSELEGGDAEEEASGSGIGGDEDQSGLGDGDAGEGAGEGTVFDEQGGEER